MRLSTLHVVLALAIVVSCQEPITYDEETTDPATNQEKQVENIGDTEEPMQDDSETLRVQDPLDPKNSELSILPPLILLDFGNDGDNSTSGDEKSKRTIDNNLGYGFARNNLFTGKSNYYFPAGKSGTTVSIEESISPFQPKTIIENVKPISEKPYPGDQNSGYGQNPLEKKNFPAASGQQSSSQTSVQTPNNQIPDVRYRQSIFGQRTKLYKPSQIDYNGYQTYTSTPKTTIASYTTSRPDYRSNAFPANQNIFVTPKPGFPSSSFNSGFLQDTHTTRRPFVSYSTTTAPSYVTPTSSSYQSSYTANSVDSFATPSPTFDGSTTVRPSNSDSLTYSPDSPLAAFANLPRYTIENGVRYENKIVWKYSDGKISQTPPTSYVNAYNEFLTKQNPGVGPPSSSYQNVGSSSQNSGPIGSYRTSGAGVNYPGYSSQGSFQNLNYPSQSLRYQSPQESRFNAETIGNIRSKSPAQFPNDQEPSKPPRPSQFVSSASLQSGNFGIGSKAPQTPQAQRGQNYELAYQGQYGLKTSLRSGNAPSSSGANSYSGASRGNTKLLKDSYGSSYDEAGRLIPKYAVNSPNPEYTYTTESSVMSTTPTSSNLFTPSGTLSPNVLSKYSTQAQKYLTKVFSPGKKNRIENYQPTSTSASAQSYGNSYINTNYENLLNYNPSISQYIRNPSSILKAQPTYIQAGNSLIPVIILRVDGAPPIQSKTTPNINLKALLQQYLTQYADSIGQNGNNFADNRPYEKTRDTHQSPIHDLTQLTHTLSQYSQNPTIVNNFAKQYQGNHNPYETSFQLRMSYDGLDKNAGITGTSNNYGSRTNKPQKIKSVQIIDDPRFTSYKVNR